MLARRKSIFTWGLVFGLLSMLISVLLLEEISPLYAKFYPQPVPLSDGWRTSQGLMFFVVVFLQPSDSVAHVLHYLSTFVQWSFIGAGLRFIATPTGRTKA